MNVKRVHNVNVQSILIRDFYAAVFRRICRRRYGIGSPWKHHDSGAPSSDAAPLREREGAGEMLKTQSDGTKKRSSVADLPTALGRNGGGCRLHRLLLVDYLGALHPTTRLTRSFCIVACSAMGSAACPRSKERSRPRRYPLAVIDVFPTISTLCLPNNDIAFADLLKYYEGASRGTVDLHTSKAPHRKRYYRIQQRHVLACWHGPLHTPSLARQHQSSGRRS